jgi:GT2 family glycosyltransferase
MLESTNPPILGPRAVSDVTERDDSPLGNSTKPGLGPSLSVVIPSRNRRAQVTALVETLLADSHVLEIVVVDDGSTDGTATALAELAATDARVKVLIGRSDGGSLARTDGAVHAIGDVIWFIDDDVMPDPGLPAMHLKYHLDGQPRVVVGYMPTRIPDERGPMGFATALYATEYEGRCAHYEEDPSGILRNLWMGNVSMRRDIYLDVTVHWPLPLPRFRHEDQNIGLRLLSTGSSAVFDRELHAVHRHKRTMAQFRRDCRLDGAGMVALEAAFPGLVEDPGPSRFRLGLSKPVAAVVATASKPGAGVVIASTLATMTRALGAARLFRAQMEVARLLRRVEQQAGYLTQAIAASDNRILAPR